MPNPFDKYKQAQVLTASREKLLILMYAGAIKFLKQAIEAEERKDKLERIRLIGKTQDIVNELRATLNHDASRELALELERLYDFITASLLKANQTSECKPMQDALKILTTLNEAWVGAVNALTQSQTAIQEEK